LCRRRVRVRDVLKHTTLGRGALTHADESVVLEFRALAARVATLLRARGMFVLDAFRAFDSDRDGCLTCSELYGGLDWLGLTDLTQDQVGGHFGTPTAHALSTTLFSPPPPRVCSLVSF
jgi:hypothetical protein